MHREKLHMKYEARFEEKACSRSYFLKVSLGKELPHILHLTLISVQCGFEI